MTYKVHNILQSFFLRAQLVVETFNFIQKVITLPRQKFCTSFSIRLAQAIHSGVGCIFDEIDMFCIVIEERDVVKLMSSDAMKFLGNSHIRSIDHAAFLYASQDAFHQPQEDSTHQRTNMVI